MASSIDVPKAEAAVRDFLAAFGIPIAGEVADTPARVVALWRDHLLAGHLAGQQAQPQAQTTDQTPGESNHRGMQALAQQALAQKTPAPGNGPVAMRNIGVHLVCPHHLTVAFGTADVAYVPAAHVVGFGALSRLVALHTSALTLQEEAGAAIANAIVDQLPARAACVRITAAHPCHNVPHGRAHNAQAVTWGQAGDEHAQAQLLLALQES